MDLGFGGAQTSAQLKCVWARNVFGRQRKSLTFWTIPTTRSMYAMV